VTRLKRREVKGRLLLIDKVRCYRVAVVVFVFACLCLLGGVCIDEGWSGG
jgi:hypothetical protein